MISALGMLALYMRYNGTGIWGGETTMQDNKSPPLKGQMRLCHGALSVVRLSVHNLPKSLLGLQSKLYSEQQQTRSDHSLRIVPGIQEFDTSPYI